MFPIGAPVVPCLTFVSSSMRFGSFRLDSRQRYPTGAAIGGVGTVQCLCQYRKSAGHSFASAPSSSVRPRARSDRTCGLLRRRILPEARTRRPAPVRTNRIAGLHAVGPRTQNNVAGFTPSCVHRQQEGTLLHALATVFGLLNWHARGAQVDDKPADAGTRNRTDDEGHQGPTAATSDQGGN